jgi:hypothetical protein
MEPMPGNRSSVHCNKVFFIFDSFPIQVVGGLEIGAAYFQPLTSFFLEWMLVFGYFATTALV